MTLFGASAKASHPAVLSDDPTFRVQIVLVTVRLRVVRSGPTKHLIIQILVELAC